MYDIIKEIFNSLKNFVDYIDLKLQTPTGKLALLIVGSIIVGGTVGNVIQVRQRNAELLSTNTKLEKEKQTLQNTLNSHISNADANCNEKIKQGALLQQQLRQIYNTKIEENKEFVEDQKEVIEEKKKILKTQATNIETIKLNLKR